MVARYPDWFEEDLTLSQYMLGLLAQETVLKIDLASRGKGRRGSNKQKTVALFQDEISKTLRGELIQKQNRFTSVFVARTFLDVVGILGSSSSVSSVN